MKKILLALLLCFVAGTMSAEEIVFNFAKPAELTPAVNVTEAETAVNDVVFNVLGATCVAKKDSAEVDCRIVGAVVGYELKIDRGATLTVTAPEGQKITKIVNVGNMMEHLTAPDESYSVKTIMGVWTGSASSVTFSATGTARIQSIIVATVPDDK